MDLVDDAITPDAEESALYCDDYSACQDEDTLEVETRPPRRRAPIPADIGGYKVIRLIGEGGMGQVFEALDPRNGQLVALKTLSDVDPAGVYKLKREFRGMADIVHHNLVTLYELVVHGDICFFTMEHVQGLDFRTALEDELGPGESRLRDALRQLTHGVHALHEAGRVHRDLKPQNVLVAESGRVVVLDFGLASEIDRQTLFTCSRGLVQGTPSYMAPEQAAGQLATPASDWYSVGALLYETLTGHVPIEGSAMETLARKQLEDPIPLSAWNLDIDLELEDLVTALLLREPGRRPGAGEILAWCTGDRGGRSRRAPVRRATASKLLGREAQLDRMQRALNEVVTGRSACVDVRGEFGTGKTALVREFLRPLRGRDDVVILESQCSERESVPFRALDGIMDQLASHLYQTPPDRRGALTRGIEAGVSTLCQVFPVLRRAKLDVEEVDARGASDQAAQRRRAFAALKELLFRLGQRAPLILVIDDLHLGDMDSARLLGELLAPPDLPSLLMITTYDPSAARESAIVRDLELLRAMVTDKSPLVVLETPPLSREHATELAAQLLDSSALARKRARAVADEAAGNPMLIEALAHEVQRDASPLLAADGASLAIGRGRLLRRLVEARRASLHPEARDLLALITVARGSLELAVLARASRARASQHTLLAQLRGSRLLRISERGATLYIDAYHEQLRVAVVRTLGARRVAESHLRLADAYREAELAEPEVLAYHLSEAGEHERAAEYAAEAGYAAAMALAFDRAAELYKLAIECRPGSWTYRRRCAEALVQAGRATEAAELYLAAAERAPRRRATELTLAAADQLLLSGHTARGLDVLRPLLAEREVELPEDATAASALLARYVDRLIRRGLAYEERGEFELPRKQLELLDLLWVVGRGLLLNEPVRGGTFLLRFTCAALELGEPRRIARGLALVGVLIDSQGDTRGEAMVAFAARIARSIHDHHAAALAAICAGVQRRNRGDWIGALSDLEHGVSSLRAHAPGGAWERGLAQRSVMAALESLGEVRSLIHRARRLHREAQESGDVQVSLLAATYSSLGLLATGSSSAARTRIRGALAYWPRAGYQIQHLQSLKVEVHCDLYDGYATDAWRRVADVWPQLESSTFLRLASRRTEALVLRARATLAHVASAPRQRGPLLAEVEQDILQLERERARYLEAVTALLRAGYLSLYDDREEVTRFLDAALAGFEAAGMMLLAACARWCKGHWVQDELLVRRAEAFMTMQSVADPASWCRVYAPGLVR